MKNTPITITITITTATEEWDKISFPTSSNFFKNYICLLVPANARSPVSHIGEHQTIIHTRTDITDEIIRRIKALDQNVFPFIFVDKRNKIESPEEFFKGFSNSSSSTESRAQLLKQLENIFQFQCGLTTVFIEASATKETLKPYYRKAALILHPDKNAGDGSKMSELNRIWNQL